jgi:hypothetical protein
VFEKSVLGKLVETKREKVAGCCSNCTLICFMIGTLRQNLFVRRNQGTETAGHVARMEGKRYVQLWGGGNLQDTPPKCIIAYRRIILKCILKQEDGKM